ncbi:hypothetical protein LPH56_00145 [Xylella taiwanensis]|uniref:hypothetical protein n=1 Tax=Xylella taiwanensis TaxID=1444770 RepID=UPI001E3670D0|nr:hypothetical protein [Xylella taiwanensis]MCD8456819.1 hypothetical protein [Xylella taiwanensis]UFN41493.1 hypothetical protein LPH57_01070 [Xylella taiwanensis]UFS49638.1 hypothetical protein LPH54_00145 [Xylella taiwanensis]UFS51925.1 hypothetical protein LPH56_00145 [Xylella taiwanensis]
MGTWPDQLCGVPTISQRYSTGTTCVPVAGARLLDSRLTVENSSDNRSSLSISGRITIRPLPPKQRSGAGTLVGPIGPALW